MASSLVKALAVRTPQGLTRAEALTKKGPQPGHQGNRFRWGPSFFRSPMPRGRPKTFNDSVWVEHRRMLETASAIKTDVIEVRGYRAVTRPAGRAGPQIWRARYVLLHRLAN
jgi:hypothetical protein